MLVRRISMVAAGLATMALSAPALADAIVLDASKIGSSYTLNYNGYSSGTTVDGLTSSTTFKLTSVVGNTYNFDYSVANTTSAPVGSRVSSFAFNTNPDISSATSTGAFSYTSTNSNYPNGIGVVDVCFKDAKTGSCAGGGSGGISTGASGSGTFALTFSQPVTSLTISDFYVRYQSVTGAGNITSASGSGTLTSSGPGNPGSTGGTPVPEPGALGLLGCAAIALAFARRRTRVRATFQPSYA